MQVERDRESSSRFDQQHRVASRDRRSMALSAVSWCAMALAAAGSLLLFAGGVSLQIDPAASSSRPALGYFMVGLAVLVVAATPLLRPLALSVRWIRMGDYRFAAAAFGVVTIMIIAAVIK